MKMLEGKDESLGGDDGNVSSDSELNVFDETEISRLFPDCVTVSKNTISSNYILHVTATVETNPKVAICLSGNTVEVHELNDSHSARLATFSEQSDRMIGSKFTDNPNVLYTGSKDGSVLLWDLRTPKESVSTFIDTANEKDGCPIKNFNSFDVSPNNRLLCAGTDLFAGDAYMIFWDIRNVKLMGAYWQCHTDDITQVKFDPNDSTKLISGSTDGLINIYDLNQTSEDDALIDSLNTESTISFLTWLNDGSDLICCGTHTEDMQLWRLDQAAPFASFKRRQIADKMINCRFHDAYIVNAHCWKNKTFMLCGENRIIRKKPILRGLNVLKNNLSPAFECPNNKQLVRCSWFNENTGLLLTGGEEGILNAWKLNV